MKEGEAWSKFWVGNFREAAQADGGNLTPCSSCAGQAGGCPYENPPVSTWDQASDLPSKEVLITVLAGAIPDMMADLAGEAQHRSARTTQDCGTSERGGTEEAGGGVMLQRGTGAGPEEHTEMLTRGPPPPDSSVRRAGIGGAVVPEGETRWGSLYFLLKRQGCGGRGPEEGRGVEGPHPPE